MTHHEAPHALYHVSGLRLTPDACTPVQIGHASEDVPAPVLACALRALRLRNDQVAACRVTRMSVDARKKTDVRLVYTVALEVKPGAQPKAPAPPIHLERVEPQSVPVSIVRASAPPSPPPVVVGLGPCGLFAALELAMRGLHPIVLERGGDVDERALDVRALETQGALNPESNLLFGEGGAGAFSDGKLTTGIKDERCARVLDILIRHGAPPDIRYLSKPHIGTDRLPAVVRAIRRTIKELDGDVRFHTRVTGLIEKNGQCAGVRCNHNGQTYELPASAVLLAIGHSARDTIQALHASGLVMQAKPFSIGLRVEHLQSSINRAQYGSQFADHPALPPAEYKLAAHLPDGRDAYTFCMCPGGVVVPASSEPGHLNVNGASAYARGGVNANSALLVGCTPADFPSDHPLAGLEMQRTIERAAFLSGGGDYRAPAQRLCDFEQGIPSKALSQAIKPTYQPGVTPADLRAVLPDFVMQAIRAALPRLDACLRGFQDPEAALTAPETRSSSPVRILRGQDGQALSLPRLYPGGEGAGYAGGIMSAAVDGLKLAERIAEDYNT